MYTHTFILPVWSLPALVNSDLTGLTSQEIEDVHKFELSILHSFGVGSWEIDNDQYFHHENDIQGTIGCDVVDAVYTVFGKVS